MEWGQIGPDVRCERTGRSEERTSTSLPSVAMTSRRFLKSCSSQRGQSGRMPKHDMAYTRRGLARRQQHSRHPGNPGTARLAQRSASRPAGTRARSCSIGSPRCLRLQHLGASGEACMGLVGPRAQLVWELCCQPARQFGHCQGYLQQKCHWLRTFLLYLHSLATSRLLPDDATAAQSEIAETLDSGEYKALQIA